MASNPANQSLEDQFLRWRQDMETKQEEQARHMAKLQSRGDHLQQENDSLRARLEGDRIENARGSTLHFRLNKIKVRSLSGQMAAT